VDAAKAKEDAAALAEEAAAVEKAKQQAQAKAKKPQAKPAVPAPAQTPIQRKGALKGTASTPRPTAAQAHEPRPEIWRALTSAERATWNLKLRGDLDEYVKGGEKCSPPVDFNGVLFNKEHITEAVNTILGFMKVKATTTSYFEIQISSNLNNRFSRFFKRHPAFLDHEGARKLETLFLLGQTILQHRAKGYGIMVFKGFMKELKRLHITDGNGDLTETEGESGAETENESADEDGPAARRIPPASAHRRRRT
jgi:hypothetical protein